VAPSVQRRKVRLTPTTNVPCSNAAKTRIPLKFGGVPQTRQQISAVNGPSSLYYQDMCRRYCCLTSFFPIVDTCLSSEHMARQICAMLPKWQFLRPVFRASRMQHISDLHSEFALGLPYFHTWCGPRLGPHHVWKYGRHPICGR